MNVQELSEMLNLLKIKTGSLLKVKPVKSDKLVFWVDGLEPAIIQYLTDDEENVVKEYLSGKNGWEAVKSGEILLFLGLAPIQVVGEDEDVKLLQNNYNVLKFLYDNKVLFWSLDSLDGSEKELKDCFEVVGEQEIPA